MDKRKDKTPDRKKHSNDQKFENFDEKALEAERIRLQSTLDKMTTTRKITIENDHYKNTLDEKVKDRNTETTKIITTNNNAGLKTTVLNASVVANVVTGRV